MNHPANGVERAWRDAAYLAALTVWLIENKSDHEADAEIADILKDKPFFLGVVINVMEVFKT